MFPEGLDGCQASAGKEKQNPQDEHSTKNELVGFHLYPPLELAASTRSTKETVPFHTAYMSIYEVYRYMFSRPENEWNPAGLQCRLMEPAPVHFVGMPAPVQPCMVRTWGRQRENQIRPKLGVLGSGLNCQVPKSAHVIVRFCKLIG